MRRIASLFIALAFLAAPVLADQDDPELDALFADLQTRGHDLAYAQQLEMQIWRHWYRHDDQEVVEVFNEGADNLRYGDLLAALERFDELVEMAPDFAEAWNRRATVQYHLGNYQESLADIDETLAREPRHFGALFGRGLVYLELEEWQKAYEAFGETLEVNPYAQNAEQLRTYLEEEHLGNPT